MVSQANNDAQTLRGLADRTRASARRHKRASAHHRRKAQEEMERHEEYVGKLEQLGIRYIETGRDESQSHDYRTNRRPASAG